MNHQLLDTHNLRFPTNLRFRQFKRCFSGKNIILFAINDNSIFCIGQVNNWLDFATDCKDKAHKLCEWIEESRQESPAPVLTILRIIEDDYLTLSFLQIQVRGISAARLDIITGGSSWWYENYKGVSNVFSAISIIPRHCGKPGDIFRSLLGIFSDLFSPKEVHDQLMSHDKDDDMERISFAFFKQLYIKTGFAWTSLTASSRAMEAWGWIPVVANYSQNLMTTDCFSGVIRLGVLGKDGKVMVEANINPIVEVTRTTSPGLRATLNSNMETQVVILQPKVGVKYSFSLPSQFPRKYMTVWFETGSPVDCDAATPNNDASAPKASNSPSTAAAAER
jgi:hypothetical protein